MLRLGQLTKRQYIIQVEEDWPFSLEALTMEEDNLHTEQKKGGKTRWQPFLDYWDSKGGIYWLIGCQVLIWKVIVNWKRSKIHLWRHSIVLALHYFQGMACYRSATLLEVMDTRSFWIMFVFCRVIYLRSCISEVHSNNSCFSINKKKNRWWQLVSNPRRLRPL